MPDKQGIGKKVSLIVEILNLYISEHGNIIGINMQGQRSKVKLFSGSISVFISIQRAHFMTTCFSCELMKKQKSNWILSLGPTGNNIFKDCSSAISSQLQLSKKFINTHFFFRCFSQHLFAQQISLLIRSWVQYCSQGRQSVDLKLLQQLERTMPQGPREKAFCFI